MIWSRGNSRQRKAVLSALSAVGETGMTLLALGLAVNLPEGRLGTILDGLVRSGQVRRRGAPSSLPGPRTAHYHLASGRHSAPLGPQLHQLPVERASSATSPFERLQPSSMSRRLVPPTGIHSTRAHGF
jgi:hypothetical protein